MSILTNKDLKLTRLAPSPEEEQETGADLAPDYLNISINKNQAMQTNILWTGREYYSLAGTVTKRKRSATKVMEKATGQKPVNHLRSSTAV